MCHKCCELLYSARPEPSGHTFCALCLERWANAQVTTKPTCPLCRADIIAGGAGGGRTFALPPVNSLIESLCQRCFPGRYQRSARSAEEQRRADEEIRLAYALARHPADALLVKVLRSGGNLPRSLELLMLRLPRREFLPPSFSAAATRIECGSISPTHVEGLNFNMTSASLHVMIMAALQLEPGHWFLDAGAGTGVVAAWAAALVGPTGASLAVDHDEGAARLMRRNRAIHDQLLYHPTMPLSGANFSGDLHVVDKVLLFPKPTRRSTTFESVLDAAAYTNAAGGDGAANAAALPVAIQIIGV